MTEQTWKVSVYRNSPESRKLAKAGHRASYFAAAYTARIDVEVRPREFATVYAGGSSERVAVQRAAAVALR